MHVVLVEPAFPKNQREFLRGLLSTGARVSAISERPAEALPSELREGLFQFERVRSVVQAEYGPGLQIVRDYDASLPEFRGDKEQLIQVVMNIVRNAAQAFAGAGRITLRSRISRQVTIGQRRHKLALDLHVIDNGPGIPEAIRDRIFFPLVSGREGGSGLGLSLAQSFVQQHGGVIECESRPGRTEFRILLPIV